MPRAEFPKPYPVQFDGNRAVAWLLALLGWHVQFDGLPTRQGVLAIYPHTSNWDFVILVLVKWAIGVPVKFWGKDRLFRIPLFGQWLTWLGGVPVDRTAARGVVTQAVEQFHKARTQDSYFWLALAPEGTRKRIPGWRSGFYQTALRTGLPLGLVRLDYAAREVRVVDFMFLSGNESEDFKHIVAVYVGVVGRHPENATPIRLLDPSVPRSEMIVK